MDLTTVERMFGGWDLLATHALIVLITALNGALVAYLHRRMSHAAPVIEETSLRAIRGALQETLQQQPVGGAQPVPKLKLRTFDVHADRDGFKVHILVTVRTTAGATSGHHATPNGDPRESSPSHGK